MVSFLTFVLIVLIFFFIFKLKATGATSTLSTAEDINTLDLNPILLNYLRTTTIIERREIIRADLIVEYATGQISEAKLKEEIAKSLNTLKEHYKDRKWAFAFRVSDPIYRYRTEGFSFDPSIGPSQAIPPHITHEKVIIPTPQKNVEVTLFLEKTS